MAYSLGCNTGGGFSFGELPHSNIIQKGFPLQRTVHGSWFQLTKTSEFKEFQTPSSFPEDGRLKKEKK
jgi:hypothetical protein